MKIHLQVWVTVLSLMVFRRMFIVSFLMLGAPIAALADTSTALGPPHTDGTPTVAPAAPSHAGPVSLMEKATDPSAVLMQLQMQYKDINIDGTEGNETQIVIQPLLPVSPKHVVRATLPYISAPVAGQRQKGLGDMVILDFQMINTKNSTIGVGPALQVPTATEDAFGSGKFSIGPDVLWIYKGLKGMQVGMLAEYFIDIAGDSSRADVSQFWWQPVYTKHFKWGFLSWTDQPTVVDFEADTVSIPFGVVIGKLFMSSPTTPWSISFEPYYTVNDRGRSNEWAVEIQFSLIRPGFKW